MLHVNDDNNDELFRRAADNYPLKTDSADWDTLRAKLDATQATDPEPQPADKRKKYRLLWLLLLLIPLGILENKYELAGRYFAADKNKAVENAEGVNKPENVAQGTAPVNTVKETTETAQDLTGNSTAVAAGSPQNNNGSPQNNNTNNAAESLAEKDNLLKENNNNIPRDNSFNSAARPGRHSKQRSKLKIKTAIATATDEDDQEAQQKVSLTNKQKQKMQTKAATTAEEGVDVKVADKNNIVTKVEEANKIDQGNIALVADEQKNEQEQTKVEKKDTSKALKEISKAETKPAKKETKKDKKSNKHFYVGLVAGPDFSSIKFHSVKKTGINYGFLAGYKINKRFSVETGILKDKKYYSTEGKYFSTKNIYLPPNAKIENVDGQCNMLEVPINFTYSFRQRAKSGFFVSAGASSYFMNKEAYVYDVTRNGYRYPYSKTYTNKSTSLFAVINIGAGYTHKLGRIADLRIEPFFRLPVNKLGTGNLPIQSAGVLVGITKTIF